jgi:hypothetical protein
MLLRRIFREWELERKIKRFTVKMTEGGFPFPSNGAPVE